MKIVLAILPFLIVQCGRVLTENDTLLSRVHFITINDKLDKTGSHQKEDEAESNAPEQTNPFIDSVSIGKDGYFKIEIEAMRLGDYDDSLFIRLLKQKKNEWCLIQKLSIYSDAMAYFSPNFEDFNNDGWNDLTLWTGDAARGANEVRTLFIFDPKKERFIHVLNSENYPNIGYNALLDCIDAWLVYGGSSTVFLRLEGDSLREFAEVAHDDLSRTVTLIDEKGNRTELESTQPKEDCYTRYCNYDPVVACNK